MTADRKNKRLERREKAQKQASQNRLVTILLITVGALFIVGAFLYPQIRPIADIVPVDVAPKAQANDNTLGDPNAPIQIVEYSDFQCPFCERFATTTEPLLEEYFINTGKVHGKDFGCALVAGPTTPYIIGGDVFVFPKSDKPGVKEAQAKLAAMMYSKDGQVAFNNKKGSIPIRTDVDLSKVDACAATGVKALKERRLLESQDQLMSPDANGAMNDAISKFWNSDQSVDDALKAMQVAVKR